MSISLPTYTLHFRKAVTISLGHREKCLSIKDQIAKWDMLFAISQEKWKLSAIKAMKERVVHEISNNDQTLG